MGTDLSERSVEVYRPAAALMVWTVGSHHWQFHSWVSNVAKANWTSGPTHKPNFNGTFSRGPGIDIKITALHYTDKDEDFDRPILIWNSLETQIILASRTAPRNVGLTTTTNPAPFALSQRHRNFGWSDIMPKMQFTLATLDGLSGLPVTRPNGSFLPASTNRDSAADTQWEKKRWWECQWHGRKSQEPNGREIEAKWELFLWFPQ